MRLSWKLGRIAGIDVYLHSTFLLLLAFIGATQGGIESVLLVSAVFACVLMHEFGHALMARRFGVETEDITLYPIGGVARLRRMPRAPGAELLIALAGPAVNVVIVIVLLAFRLLFVGEVDAGWGVSPLDYYSLTLIQINTVLALFNMIPAFPMDGGRVLRALLSGWLGRVRATMVAAGIGRGLALMFGVYCLVTGNWMQVILALFIYAMAGMELTRVLVEERQRDEAGTDHGIATAPPGFRWVSRGDGVWQLAPISGPIHDVHPQGNTTPWV